MKVKVKVAQWNPTLCDPMDYTVRGILQARILEWVAFPFSRGSSQLKGNSKREKSRNVIFLGKGDMQVISERKGQVSELSYWKDNWYRTR